MERCKFKIVMELHGFYDPEKETKTDAESRIALLAEMTINKYENIRAHTHRFIPEGE